MLKSLTEKKWKHLDIYLPGQGNVLQSFVWSQSPVQFFPPKYGPSHDLFLDWVPFPHVKLHADQSPQALNTPSTVTKANKNKYFTKKNTNYVC